jgi:Tol biopolymer transport system component
MTPAGALQTRLTNNPAQDKNPAWAPDNTAIAFSSNRSGILNLWAIAPDGSNPSQLIRFLKSL